MRATAETVQVTQTLDAKGLNCPLPILKAKKAISGLGAGDVLQVVSTDPGSVADFASFCRQTGNELAASNAADGVFEFLIRKA
ncbi:sulfurtransferase TusA family protein [Rhodoblastus sp.]|uniref:sulfurtransferase TusA family protein n=1 Tax=Rhodoblastus sp. TaxID=1962975 RepID=UPI00260C3B00|nr:sulfurtransferase TusA family protein [Rhodoblastus sp.]